MTSIAVAIAEKAPVVKPEIQAEPISVSLGEAFWVWVKVAIYSFGGPAGQIAVMHKLLVEKKRWISESRFLHALNYTMLLPGPEAQQLATYIGWLLHRTRGGLIAGTLFILPGFISILILSILYAGFQQTSIVAALFFGLKPAVMAIVVEAVIRIGKRVLKNEVMVGIAAVAFVGIFFFNLPFPLIVLFAGMVGYIGGRLWLNKFDVIKERAIADTEDIYLTDMAPQSARPTLARTFKILTLGLTLWFLPIIILTLILGAGHVFVTEGVFFSKTAVVTFGGAYAVLAYIAQQGVNTYHWLLPGEMLDGLGMAETTPGPLVQVVQFVGFMGAYRNPGALDPMVAGVIGSIVTTWVTFVPCFLWIFLGAPYIEHLRGKKSLTTALSAITASVVGVVLNLAVWFSVHTLFASVNEEQYGAVRWLVPDFNTVDLGALLIGIGAFVAMFRFKTGMFTTLAGCSITGIIYYLLFVA